MTPRRAIACSLALSALLAVSACSPGVGQQIEVVELNQARDALTPARLFFLLPDADPLPETAYVGRLRSVVSHEGRSTLDRVYPELRRRANELGANAYKVREGCSGSGPCEVTVDLFAVPEEVIGRGPASLPPDVVVVFGGLHVAGEPTRFRVNGEPAAVSPLRYVAYSNTEGSLNVSVGGALGASLTLEGGRQRAPSFWSLTGFGVGPGRGSGLGMSFNTGRVHPVDSALGRFLVAVLEEEGP